MTNLNKMERMETISMLTTATEKGVREYRLVELAERKAQADICRKYVSWQEVEKALEELS